jgi:hypothetical protein
VVHSRQVDLSGKLQIKPGQSAAVLNAPPGLALPGVPAAASAADADAVIAFVTRREDLDSAGEAVAAARADRLAWIGYPKGGQLGTDLNRDRLAAALADQGVQPVRQVCPSTTPGPRCGSAPPPGETRYRLARRRSGTNQITATATNRA